MGHSLALSACAPLCYASTESARIGSDAAVHRWDGRLRTRPRWLPTLLACAHAAHAACLLGHPPPPVLWPRPSLAIHVHTATAHDTAFTGRRHRCKRISSEFGWGPAWITTVPAPSRYGARYYIIISITVAALERARRTLSTARITRSHAAVTGQQMYVFRLLLCPAVTSLTRTFQFLASRRFYMPGSPSDRSSSSNHNEPRLHAPTYSDDASHCY